MVGAGFKPCPQEHVAPHLNISVVLQATQVLKPLCALDLCGAQIELLEADFHSPPASIQHSEVVQAQAAFLFYRHPTHLVVGDKISLLSALNYKDLPPLDGRRPIW